MNIQNVFYYLHSIFSSPPLLFGVLLLSITVKIFILIKLIIKRSTAFKSSLSLYFLMGILISSAIQEFDFIIGLINDIFFDSFEHQMFIFSRRMAWASVALQYQFLAL